MTARAAPPAAKLRVVQVIVASCFYAELASQSDSDAGGVDRFLHWTGVFAPSDSGYDEPEAVKAREDLARCGQDQFSQDWEFLRQLVLTEGRGAVQQVLQTVFAQNLAEGYERRRRRTGVA